MVSTWVIRRDEREGKGFDGLMDEVWTKCGGRIEVEIEIVYTPVITRDRSS